MTSSSGTNRVSYRSAVGARRLARCASSRGSSGGTLTRAKCSLAGLGVDQDDGEVEREPGDVGERVGRVDGQRRQHREDLARGRSRCSRSCSASAQLVPADDARCPASARAGRTSLVEDRGVHGHAARGPTSEICSSTSRGSSPEAERTARPVAMRRLSPATRTMKNSSRLLAKMARKRARSSSGSVRVLGQLQHPLVELQPGDLAVEEPVLGQAALGPGSPWVEGTTRMNRPLADLRPGAGDGDRPTARPSDPRSGACRGVHAHAPHRGTGR